MAARQPTTAILAMPVTVIAVEHPDGKTPQVQGIAYVDVRVPKDGDAVELVASQSKAVRSWLSAK